MTLVICTFESSTKYGPMMFYNLNLKKVVKIINDGRGYISYKPAIEPEQHGLLTYLCDRNSKSLT